MTTDLLLLLTQILVSTSSVFRAAQRDTRGFFFSFCSFFHSHFQGLFYSRFLASTMKTSLLASSYSSPNSNFGKRRGRLNFSFLAVTLGILIVNLETATTQLSQYKVMSGSRIVRNLGSTSTNHPEKGPRYSFGTEIFSLSSI